jgi:hypothetical protein
MNSADLSPTQAQVLYLVLRSVLWYLAKLQGRIKERRFS